MEEQIRLRSALRKQFTKNANKLCEEKLDEGEKNILLENIKNIHEKLEKVNVEIQSLIVKRADFKETMIEKDLEDCENYMLRWLKIKSENTPSINLQNKGNTHMKLPKIDIPKFNGQLNNWLPFWSQFRKIHEGDIDTEDKFIYLVQAMSVESEAKSLVNSYPISKENYEKCVEHLKSRYGREDLQIQVYVRELLALVLQKATGGGEELAVLYDKISAHLRALETLGVTKNHAAFLLPLVESSLPQEILKTWQRSKNNENIDEELSNLLIFLQKEVENEQRIKMANTFSKNHTTNNTIEIPTANCLAATVKEQLKHVCLWCDKDGHSSIECYKLQKLSVEKRKEIIMKKKACTICLRKGHFWKNCKASVKCLICNKRHSTVICTTNKVTPSRTDESTQSDKNTTAATSSTKGNTLLQTVMVEIQHKGKGIRVRALLDSGSQKTYIKQEIIENLQITAMKEEVLTHTLFGGLQTPSKLYKVYKLDIRSLDNSFKIDLEALGSSCLCTNVPTLNFNDTVVSKLLKSNKIYLTDKGDSTDIGLLIGADFLGPLMTGTIIQLQNGLVAIRTKLGWTLQGKQVSVQSSNIINVLHCTCDNEKIYSEPRARRYAYVRPRYKFPWY